jgi:homoserine O-acetyltransferase/O-succinyltransferase
MFSRARFAFCCLAVFLAMAWPRTGSAYDGLVKKQVFTIPSFTTVGGDVLKNVRFGFETYGKVNANKDNVILILPFFSGNGHAAGKFAASDQDAGYWDSIIGPGKPLDTDQFCILAGDGLISQPVKDGQTVTTGPASIDPSTGKPYGMRFPILTMKDLVTAQKALVDSLGIKKLHAVMGLSMGGLQTFEWAATFPDSTDRAIPIVGLAESDGYLIEFAEVQSAAVKADPKWNNGDYYGKEEPLDGVTMAFKIILHQGGNYASLDKTVGRKWAQDVKDPAKSWDNRFQVQQDLDDLAVSIAKTLDANSFLYQAKAVQLFVAGDEPTLDAGLARIKARLLIMPARSDLTIYPKYSQEAAERLEKLGKSVQYHEIPGDGGHFDAIDHIDSVGDQIKEFLK